MSTGCPFWGPEFDSQTLRGNSQLFVTAVPRNTTSSPGLCRHYTHVVHKHTCRQNTHIELKFLKRKLWRSFTSCISHKLHGFILKDSEDRTVKDTYFILKYQECIIPIIIYLTCTDLWHVSFLNPKQLKGLTYNTSINIAQKIKPIVIFL